ncbi:MAG: hypothetical protein R3C05_06450 [Pirellulaceae bacterium]
MKGSRHRFVISLSIASFIVAHASAEAQPITKNTTSGPVEVRITLDPPTPLIGDPVTLRIEVVAEEDVEVLMPEFGEALDRFAVLDFVPRQSIDADGNTLASQQYRLQPPTSGEQSIPPILIEYVDNRPGEVPAPEGYDAYEILTPRLDFNVESVLPENASHDLKPPLGRLEPQSVDSKNVWTWLTVPAVILLAIATPFLWRAYAARRSHQRRMSAYETARWRLDQLLHQPRISPEEIDVFYVDLSNIVRRYLEDRFELRAPELTTEEFLNSLQESPDMSREHQLLLREFLRHADLVKFARALPSEADVQRSIDAASQFLEETRG